MQTPIQKGETDESFGTAKNKPKDFWDFIKAIGRNSYKLPMSLETAEGMVVKETGEVLEAWKDYFCKLLNQSLGNGRQTNVRPIDSLSTELSILPGRLLASMRDWVASNGVAMETLVEACCHGKPANYLSRHTLI